MEEYLNKHYREYFRGEITRLKSINNCYYQAEDQRTISHEELFKIYWDRFPKYETPFQVLLSATSKAPPGIKKFRGDYKKRSIKALCLAQSSAFAGNYNREFKLKTMKRRSIESIESRMRNFQYFYPKQVCTCRKFDGNSVKYSHTLQVSNESQNTNISNCINSWGKSVKNSLESDNTTSLFTKIVSKALSYNHINCEGPKWGKSENSKNLMTNNPNLTTIVESHCETEELKDKLYFNKITANKLCGTLNDNSESACSFDHSTNISDLQSHLSPSIQDTSIFYKSIDYSTATILPLESSNHSILYSDSNCNSDKLANYNLKKKVEQQIHMQLPLHGRINSSNENFSNYLNSVKRIPFVFPPPIKNKILSKQVLPSLNCEISTSVLDKFREETQDKKTMIEQLKPEMAIKKCEIRSDDQYDQILDNPIPFKSDLLSARWNRRIRTTIPYSQNKVMDKQVWFSMNNPFENFLNTENEYTRVNLDIEGVSRNPIIVNNPEICEVPPSLLHFKQESSDILDNSVKLRVNKKSKYIEPLPIQPNTDQYDNKHKLKSHIITPLDPLNLQGLIKEDNHEEVKNIDTVKIMTDLDIPDKRDNNETGYNYFETPEDTQIAAKNICYKEILPVKNDISQESSNIRITVDYSSEESTLGAQENSPKILGAEPNLIMDPGNNYNKDIISRNCMTNLRGFGRFNSALLVSKYIDSLDKLECIHCIICENKIGGFDMESNSKYHGDTSVWRLSRYFIKKIEERWRNRKRIYISQFLISLIFLLFSLILLPLITYSNFYLSNSLIFVVYIITIPLCVFGGLFGTFLGFYFLDNLKDFKELAYSVKIDLINEVKRIKNELCENDVSEKNLDCELSSIPIEDVYYPSLPNEMLDHLFESLFNYFNDEQSLFGGNTTKISDMTSKILQIEKNNINIFLYTGTSIYFFNIIINITLWILDTNHNYSLLLFGSICFILVSVISWLIILYKILWKGSKFHIGLSLFSAVFRPLLLSPKSCAEALKLRAQLILSVVLIFTCGSIDHIKRKKETKFNILNIPLQHIKGILAMNCQPLQKINRYILTRLRLRLNKFDSKFLNSNNIVLSSIFTSSLWPFTYISFSSSDILITSFNFSNCRTTQKDLSKENYILSVPLNAMSVQCVMASSSASELLDYFNPNESSIDFESNLLYFLNNPLFTTSPKVYEDNFASIVSTVRNLAINYTEDGLTGDDLLESYFEEAKRDEYVYLVYCNFPVEYCFWHQVQNIFSPCTSDEYVTVAFILYNIEDVLVLYRHIS